MGEMVKVEVTEYKRYWRERAEREAVHRRGLASRVRAEAVRVAMTLQIPTLRPPVIRDETASPLDEFRRFRHRVRHAYGFTLRWPTLRGLLDEFGQAHQMLVADVQHFVAFLKAMAEED